jgi:hypothetical protein
MLINALEKEGKNHHFLKFNDDKNYEFLISFYWHSLQKPPGEHPYS